MATIKIKQVRSKIKCPFDQKLTPENDMINPLFYQ